MKTFRRSRKSLFTSFIEMIFDSFSKGIEEKKDTCAVSPIKSQTVFEPEAKTRRTYPEFKVDMLPKEHLKTLDAAKLYRRFMLEIGFYDISEISEKVSFVREEMSSYVDVYQEDVDCAGEELEEAKTQLEHLKEKFKNDSAAQREKVESEIKDLKEEIESFKECLQEAKDELSQYKSDKRNFLYNYINREVHGPRLNVYPF